MEKREEAENDITNAKKDRDIDARNESVNAISVPYLKDLANFDPALLEARSLIYTYFFPSSKR